MFNTTIRSNVKVEEAPFADLPVTEYKPTSNGSIDYKKFVDEIIKRLDLDIDNVAEMKEVK